MPRNAQMVSNANSTTLQQFFPSSTVDRHNAAAYPLLGSAPGILAASESLPKIVPER
jgi:hypothetical protein